MAGGTGALRVLCLHGMYQDGATFARKTKHLCAAHPNELVDFVFVDGPFTVVPPILLRKTPPRTTKLTNGGDGEEKRVRGACAKRRAEFRAWWRPLGVHQTDPNQLDADRAVLLSFLRDQLSHFGGFDAVMGFSQGASLAAWMCTEQAKYELEWSPKAAVLIGSYLGPPQYSLQPGMLAGIPSLHLFGANDHVIPAAKSQFVADVFKEVTTEDAEVVTSTHSQGHVIPKGDVALGHFQRFLADHLLEVTASKRAGSTSPRPVQEPHRHYSSP